VFLPFAVDAKIPLSRFNPKTLEIDTLKIYIIVCQRGVTSYTALKKLKSIYPNLKALSLKEGIEEF